MSDFTTEIQSLGRKKFDSHLLDYPLFETLQEFLGNPLNLVHERFDKHEELLDFNTDQSTVIHKEFYKHCEEELFLESYYNFVKSEILPHFDEGGQILVQRIPSFRVQIPKNIAVAEFHKDADYSHNVNETNIFLPFTDAFDTSTVWAETKSGSTTYEPLNTKLGEMWIWDGANCLHGNKVNESARSRISFDFRVLPKKYYKENSNLKSVTTQKQMTIGDYWLEM